MDSHWIELIFNEDQLGDAMDVVEEARDHDKMEYGRRRKTTSGNKCCDGKLTKKVCRMLD